MIGYRFILDISVAIRHNKFYELQNFTHMQYMGFNNYGIPVMENQRFPSFCGFNWGRKTKLERGGFMQTGQKLDYSSVHYF
jgi:hypothetical protein